MRNIYADNAATTKLDADAFEAMKLWLVEEYANASQPYFFSRKPKEALRRARKIIAECINAEPEEIFFTSGGTEGNNWAVKEFINPERKKILTSAIEHKSILQACKRRGYSVDYMLPDKSGTITPEIFERHLAADTALASVMLANNEIGTIQPVKDLCDIAHAQGALFHTDAVQAVGHIAIDVKKLGVDMLSASAHKFNGPKGIGFLYVKDGVNLYPLLDGGAQEYGMRAGTENVASIVGMSFALKKNIDALEFNQEHVGNLEQLFMRGLNENKIPHVRNGSEHTLPGLISLSFDGKNAEAILHRMDLMGIRISTGSACDSHETQFSHVLQALNLPDNLARGTIRISLSKDNTAEEVRAIVAALKKIIL